MRILIVSNRLPITIEGKGNKGLVVKSSVGGLVSGISDYLSMLKLSLTSSSQYIWIGSPGIYIKERNEAILNKLLKEYSCKGVILSEDMIDKFYHGFCNRVLWPLFHSFPTYVEYNNDYWQVYKEVNGIFADSILKIMDDEDVIWVHDYHLMLLPQLIRERKPFAKIIFFLHIPFPNFEIFRLLPKMWRVEILKGVLGADVVGFHTYEYSQHFLQCVLRILGYTNEAGRILTDDRLVKSGAFPMGINFEKFNSAIDNPQIKENVNTLKEKFKDYKVLLSIDRLDYTKGIRNRLEGYDLFLRNNPKYLKKVVLIMIIVPGRVGIEHYQRTKKEIDELIGRINGEFGDMGWLPILYQNKFLSFEEIVSLYNISDTMLVTPLRDGMNLIAKEYIASRRNFTGVLILSEMAGASWELTEAILVNPNDINGVAYAIKEAVELPIEEQINRNKVMQTRLKRYDINRWGDELMKELVSIKKEQSRFFVKLLDNSIREKLFNDYKKAKRRLIFLDYDGTIVPFVYQPLKATPDEELLELLKKLTIDNEVVILSGRDKSSLDNWFGFLKINLVAEHGVWIRRKEDNFWKMLQPLNSEWKK
ncbi:MAG: bifunctional alpha,alpha-trehalose-phosphate synthase (UDP-forming)/trehalose-phosphatase, partial [Candidatus Omnitrophica bacterium]|nr:bifunctional alpha,alpha-trehalose-phosphate synthase (UDP-forming)/trehalose-phosphatase [Candidatus Omnitrophota bacterium]